MAEVLEPFGLSKEISEQVALALRNVERDQINQTGSILPTSVSNGSGSHLDDGEEKGLTPFLLRHEGIQPISSSRMYVSGFLIAISYFGGGLIPLLPYIFINDINHALYASTVVTGVVLLLFGMIKQRATGGPCDAKGLIWSALSTLSGELQEIRGSLRSMSRLFSLTYTIYPLSFLPPVGGLAAAASFAIVRALET